MANLLKLAKGKTPRGSGLAATKVEDRFPAEIHMEQTRLSGVSPKLVRAYNNPARLLPKSKSLAVRGLKALGGGK